MTKSMPADLIQCKKACELLEKHLPDLEDDHKLLIRQVLTDIYSLTRPGEEIDDKSGRMKMKTEEEKRAL